ncbi:hypothetical protein AVEN_35659-1 [Araneus ventricosus]|uniref:ATP-dependent DNA helicase n=1 Tax=Araneus ventricosus TaxID=182803 RepID=A0A4Y2GAB7_ARAVE|nr:hypothetical protein AVEN_35659-1 [Araneus ventricosus]
MTDVHAFLAVDRLLQDLTKCKEPFGGKVILLGGDLRQVLPGFWCLVVGRWREKSGSTIQLPLQCYPSIQDPIHQLYSDIEFSSVTPQELKDRAVLTVNNERSMEINNKVLEFMPGNETVYKAVDMIMSEDPQDQLTFPEEFLNSLTPTGFPPYELKLKIGCIIMLLRNLAPSKGLCNGTHLIITKLQQNIIQAKSIDGTETFLIPQIPLIPSQTNMPFKFKRGRGCSDTEVANYENVGHDCGNRAKALDSTEKTIEERGEKLLIGIWTEKTGFSLEKLEQIMYLPS